MRTQVIALLFVALIASAHCQTTPIGKCLEQAFQLGQSIGEFINAKQWNSLTAVTKIIDQVNSVIASCGSAISTLKSEQSLASFYNPNCYIKLSQAITRIIQLRGSFNGGMNKDAVLNMMLTLGLNTAEVAMACS